MESNMTLALVMTIIMLLLPQDSNAKPLKGKKGKKNSSSYLAGKYYSKYNVLFAEREELALVEKFIIIDATEDAQLFHYRHCWRLADGGTWNYERGGLVVSGKGDFTVAEVSKDIVEGSTGFFSGYLSDKDRLMMTYTGIGRGIVFHMEPERQDEAMLDENACPMLT